MPDEEAFLRGKKPCECGYCNLLIPKYKKNGQPNKYAKGHYARPKIERICSNCKSKTTKTHQNTRVRIDGTVAPPYDHWYKDGKGGWHCHDCHQNLVSNVKWNPIAHAKYNPRRLTYKGKVVMLKEERRIGVCNLCRAIVGEIDAQVGMPCQRTNMHHLEYHDDNVLEDTIELCMRCHQVTKNGFYSRKMDMTGRICIWCLLTFEESGERRWYSKAKGLQSILKEGEVICRKCYFRWYHHTGKTGTLDNYL